MRSRLRPFRKRHSDPGFDPTPVSTPVSDPGFAGFGNRTLTWIRRSDPDSPDSYPREGARLIPPPMPAPESSTVSLSLVLSLHLFLSPAPMGAIPVVPFNEITPGELDGKEIDEIEVEEAKPGEALRDMSDDEYRRWANLPPDHKFSTPEETSATSETASAAPEEANSASEEASEDSEEASEEMSTDDE